MNFSCLIHISNTCGRKRNISWNRNPISGLCVDAKLVCVRKQAEQNIPPYMHLSRRQAWQRLAPGPRNRQGNARHALGAMYRRLQTTPMEGIIHEEDAANKECLGSVLGPRCIIDEGIPASIDARGGYSAAARCAVPAWVHLTL